MDALPSSHAYIVYSCRQQRQEDTWKGVEIILQVDDSLKVAISRERNFQRTTRHVWVMSYMCRFSAWRSMTCTSCVYNIPCYMPVSTRHPTLWNKEKLRYHAPACVMCWKITRLLHCINKWWSTDASSYSVGHRSFFTKFLQHSNREYNFYI